MDYKDFVVAVSPEAAGGYRASILDSPFDLEQDAFTPPYEPAEVEGRLDAFDSQLKSYLKKTEDAEPVLAASQRATGLALYRSLFAGEVGRCFDKTLAHVETVALERPSTGLRIQLVFDPDRDEVAHLAALPWELLYQEDTRDFLARLRRTLVVRYLKVGRLIRPLEVAGRLRVLLVASAPSNWPALDLAAEQRRIREALEGVGAEVRVYEQPDLGRLHRQLLDDPVHVLHFMGHGGFRSGTGIGALAFVGPDEKDRRVTGEMFAEDLKGIDELRLVVLSSCRGAALRRRRGQHPFASVAAALVQAGVPAVVAMQFPISDPGAIEFSTAFYQALAHGDPVDVAVTEGRLALFRNQETRLEWATPALFMRVRDGRIFAPAAASAAEPEEAATGASPRREQRPLRVGILSFANGWGRGMEEECDRFLSLDEYFEDRYVRDDALWMGAIFPKVEEFLFRATEERRPFRLDFAAHASIAFAAGYCLDAKSGFDVVIRQRSQHGTGDWWPHDAPAPEGSLWREDEELPGAAAASDVALAVSVTRSVVDDVKVYVEQSRLAVRRILPVTLWPEPSPTGVRNGTHALALAQQLGNRIRSRTIDERRGVLHVFASAPNAFLFYLGQLARGFGRVRTYEYAFGSGEVGAYRPSIELPPPDAAGRP